ncbi:MAG: DUF899 domain-containing protein [Rhodospirillales bacterium]|nr:DUF899 domain-containing protein [Rhodospirillales bacterium]
MPCPTAGDAINAATRNRRNLTTIAPLDVRCVAVPRLVARRQIPDRHIEYLVVRSDLRRHNSEGRVELLKAEKEHTRRGDVLAEQRQALPWVRLDKDYLFETEQGAASLEDLFKGRSQLLVYHFMFGPDYVAGCPSCSAIADGFNGIVVHLENHDVAFSAVSRTPLAKLQAFKRRMAWTFPWASSLGGDFNFEFNVSFTEQQQRDGTINYNFRRAGHSMDAGEPPPAVVQTAAMTGTDVPTFARDRPGLCAFVREDGAIYHTYSSYARGMDGIWGMYHWLDRAPKGRNEAGGGVWWRHHDKYEKA